MGWMLENLRGCCSGFELSGGLFADPWHKPYGGISSGLRTRGDGCSTWRCVWRRVSDTGVFLSWQHVLANRVSCSDRGHCLRMESQRHTARGNLSFAQHVPRWNCHGNGTGEHLDAASFFAAHVAAVRHQFSREHRTAGIHTGDSLLGGQGNEYHCVERYG